MICSLWPCRHHYQRHFCNCGCHCELCTVGEALRKSLEMVFWGDKKPFAIWFMSEKILEEVRFGQNVDSPSGDTVIHVKVLYPSAVSILPKTNIFALKMDGWKTSRSFWGTIFTGYIRLREGTIPTWIFQHQKTSAKTVFFFHHQLPPNLRIKNNRNFHGWSTYPPSEMRGLIAGLKGNQWLRSPKIRPNDPKPQPQHLPNLQEIIESFTTKQRFHQLMHIPVHQGTITSAESRYFLMRHTKKTDI